MKKLLLILGVTLGLTCVAGNSIGNGTSDYSAELNARVKNPDQGKGKGEKGQQPKQQQGKTKEAPKQQGKTKEAPKQQQQNKKQESKPQSNKKPSNQSDKGNNKLGKQQGNKAEKGNDKGNNKGVFKGNKAKGSPSNSKQAKGPKRNFKHPYKYDSPGIWYSYGKNKGFYYGRNYGQWRSAQARNKHKHFHPVYEYEALTVFSILVERNVFLITQTDHKFVFLRTRLRERRDAGLITVVYYEDNLRRIETLERRRETVELSLSVHL